MSSLQEMGAQPSTVGCIQEKESFSSSQEHRPASVHRNDEAAALKEAVSEECTDVRNAGPPGPGGRKKSKSNQANERVNQSQQAISAEDQGEGARNQGGELQESKRRKQEKGKHK